MIAIVRRRDIFFKKPLVAALVALAAVVLVACSGSGDNEAPPTPTDSPPSADDQAYLDEILGIDTLIGAVVVSVESALEGSYGTRGRLFELVGEQDVLGTYETMIARAETVDVPARYEADHERYRESLKESVLLAEKLQPAIDARDLVAFDVATVELFVSRGRLLIDVSPSFCAGALRSDAAPGCSTIVDLPGGLYGVELRSALRRFQADFVPRVSDFPPAMSQDEIFDELSILQPPIIEAIETAREDVEALDPPTELAEDHAVIAQYFENILDVSLAISEAADERDSEAQQIEFVRSGSVRCEAALALSDGAQEITPFFNAGGC